MKTAKIDLHLHLDGSLNVHWMYEMSKKRGVIEPETSFEQYYKDIYCTAYTTMEEAFRMFDRPIDVMQHKEDIAQTVYDLVGTLDEKGMIYAEIRFAPQQHMKCGLSQYEVVEAAVEGLNRAKKDYPDMTAQLINCMMHKGENAFANMQENYETIEVTKEFLGKGVCALDLAGYENNGDFKLYAPLFEKAREYGIPYTIHAGEMGLGVHVIEAMEMGAYRIGHGVNCVQDDAWLKAVADAQIPLEVCVTSNCGDGRNYAAHPVRKLIEAGVKVTINTDNMMFSRTDMRYEHAMLKNIGVSEAQLKQCTLNAVDAAFCDETTKEMLRAKLALLWG